MGINRYDKGDIVRVFGEFRNLAGALIDPTNLSIKFTNIDGVVTTYIYGTNAELARDSTGIFHADLVANLAGRWYYRWQSTGVGQGGQEGEFVVESGAF
jgi:hypothetical protein